MEFPREKHAPGNRLHEGDVATLAFEQEKEIPDTRLNHTHFQVETADVGLAS